MTWVVLRELRATPGPATVAPRHVVLRHGAEVAAGSREACLAAIRLLGLAWDDATTDRPLKGHVGR
jgi:hypothetical protein